MHDGLDRMSVEEGLDSLSIRQVPFHEGGSGMHRRAVAHGEVIQDDDVVAGLDQPFDGDTADVSGPAGHQDRVRHGSVLV